MSIKAVLREELDNSLRMQERYEQELSKLPKGSLVKRRIKGRDYYYLVFREDGKVRSVYRGKPEPAEIAKYRLARDQRGEGSQALVQGETPSAVPPGGSAWKRANMTFASRCSDGWTTRARCATW
jgi:hypothetical protein